MESAFRPWEGGLQSPCSSPRAVPAPTTSPAPEHLRVVHPSEHRRAGLCHLTFSPLCSWCSGDSTRSAPQRLAGQVTEINTPSLSPGPTAPGAPGWGRTSQPGGHQAGEAAGHTGVLVSRDPHSEPGHLEPYVVTSEVPRPPLPEAGGCVLICAWYKMTRGPRA